MGRAGFDRVQDRPCRGCCSARLLCSGFGRALAGAAGAAVVAACTPDALEDFTAKLEALVFAVGLLHCKCDAASISTQGDLENPLSAPLLSEFSCQWKGFLGPLEMRALLAVALLHWSAPRSLSARVSE